MYQFECKAQNAEGMTQDCIQPQCCGSKFYILHFTFFLLLAAGCASSSGFIDTPYQQWTAKVPPDASERLQRVFLIGHTGEPADTYPVLDLLREMALAAGPRSTTLFLGDLVPCCGLPDSGAANRVARERLLRRQLDAVKQAPGNVYLIAGDKDWDGSRGSLAGRKNLDRFIERYLDRGNVFLPDHGFPGPHVVELGDDIVLMLLDTQWWLSEGEKAFGDTGAYDLNEASDFLREMKEQLHKYRNEKILIAGHHPLYTNGAHGGHFPARAHLTPVPLLGSLEPFYRRYIGANQDLAHHTYRLFKSEMLKLFEERSFVYAAAHDHSLQYFPAGTYREPQHFIVSGAGVTGSYAAHGRGAAFIQEAPGFMVLDYYADNSIWLTGWSADEENEAGKMLFRYPIQEPAPDPIPDNLPAFSMDTLSFQGSTVRIAANPQYADASRIKRLFRGNLHRDLWGTPVEVPVLDLGTVEGGLQPLKIGGRGQSISLRVENLAGRQFVLRSIDKVAGKAWAPELRTSFLRNLIQDQMSMLHPYGAFAIPPLAEAAGVYHTNPRLFYVPNDPRLGLSREQLAGTLVLFEERPDGDMSDVPGMGGAEDVISTVKLFDEIDNDNDHRVDARAFARARLFDMLINDWDRHADQWRWGAFEPADSLGKIYRPIPRDRDVAFSIVDGIVPTLSKILLDPKFQEFESDYGYIKGLNKNGFPLDRRFTASLVRKDWIDIADSIKIALTDEVIEKAIAQWPAPVYEKNGAYAIETLKQRRDQLNAVAVEYYNKALAPTVDIVGSNKHERFEVRRLNDRETEVRVFKTTREGEIRKEIFRRTFLHAETREVRLYGLGGQDQFIVGGHVKKGLHVIAVGGPGNDEFIDASGVAGTSRHTRFYDTESNNVFVTSRETKIFRSDRPANNAYDLYGHKYDLTRPMAFVGSNKDDGLLLGGGIRITRHRFKKAPFARLHMLRTNIALNAESFNIVYEGLFTSVFSGWDVSLVADVRSPNTILNFYGYGNETGTLGQPDSYFRTRHGTVSLAPALQHTNDQGATLRVGPHLYFSNLEQDSTRYIGQFADLPEQAFAGQWYGGLRAGLSLESVDNRLNPARGFRWHGQIESNLGISNASGTYSSLHSWLVLYLSPGITRQVTLALRAGGTHVLGDFPFHAGAILGNKTSLRGFVSTRFTGRSSFYHNAELRLEIARFASYLAAGSLGLIAFLDNGRVWADHESSSRWHQGYGGGAWVGLFDRVVLSGMLGFSKEDTTLNIKLGFMY